MDWKSFIVAMVGHTAWPCATLLVIVLAYWKRNNLFGILKTFKYKEIELTFNEKLTKIESKFPSESIGESSTEIGNDIYGDIIYLSKLDSSTAVLKIWKDLVGGVYRIRAQNGMVRFVDNRDVIEALVEQGMLSRDNILLFDELGSLKDLVIGEFSPDYIPPNQIVRYKILVDALLEKIDKLSDGGANIVSKKREEAIKRWDEDNKNQCIAEELR